MTTGGHVTCLASKYHDNCISTIQKIKKEWHTYFRGLSTDIYGPKVLPIVHDNGEVIDVAWIHFATRPLLCMYITEICAMIDNS